MPARILLMVVSLLLAPASLAEGLIGYAFVNNISGVNLEWTFKRNSVYAVPGVFFDSGGARTDKIRWVAGIRHRIDEGTMDTSGFYTGLMAGDLDGRRQYDRLGAGGELGYQWVTDNTRWTLSSGLVALEEQEEREVDAEPEVFFAFSISLR